MSTLTEDCQALRDLRTEEDQAKAEYEEIKQVRVAREAALFQRMRDEESDGHKTTGFNFVPTETLYASVQDRAAFVAWAKENDDELIEDKERKQLLSALVRERVDNGEPLPPGVGFYVKEYISVRAS